MKAKRILRWILPVTLCLIVTMIVGTLGINTYMLRTGKARILSEDAAASLSDVDCILVLGCLVKNDGTPSDMLTDRLICGTRLYQNGAAPKLLMSGDHGQSNYNEVGAMKNFALSCGIDSSDIFMDHAGFSTYESLYRAKEIFCAKKIIIVTQEYHLYRALHIANQLGLEAYGVASDLQPYSGQALRDAREILARVKDFALAIAKPIPTFLGEVIPIHGDGDLTND